MMKLDWTPLGHALCVLLLQLVAYTLFNDALVAGLVGSTFFFAREHTQAEYRWIAKYGLGKRENMPWYGGFDPKVWDVGSLLDALIPLLFASAFYFVGELCR